MVKAWRVCGKTLGEIVYADDEAAARKQYEYIHDGEPDEISRVEDLDGEPRDSFSNAELQRAGFAVFCDRCLDADAIMQGIDDPPGYDLAIINDQTVCEDCITPRERLTLGGDPDDCIYADEYMDLPMAALPRDAVPLADQETSS
jgi:hypothetical protein